MQANRDIVTNPGFRPIGVRLIRVRRKPTRRRETGVESDENRLNGRPPLTNWGCLRIQNDVEADARAVVRRFRYPDARVRHGSTRGADDLQM